MAKLWTKDGRGLDKVVERYCFAGDVELDRHLVRHDILGSLAHAAMLRRIGVLSPPEHRRLAKGLAGLLEDHAKGRFTIRMEDEDVHTAVEARLGKAGEKLHTARSRNDQVLTDTRLYALEHLAGAAAAAMDLAGRIAVLAARHEFLPMPGYTHLQRAMPSSWGMWLGAFAEELLDTAAELEAAWTLLDQCPLGSGAGYGVSLDIDRRFTAKLLGFSRVQANSIYCQNSRGHFEAALLSALSSLVSVLGRLSADVCLFATREFGFVALGDAVVTGSSIMPQKRNPDLFELVRARAVTLAGLAATVRGVTHGLTSGYSKDLQEVKAPLIDGLRIAEDSLAVCAAAVVGLRPDAAAMRRALSPEIYAADHAYDLVRRGVPFRQAYHRVKAALADLSMPDPAGAIRRKRHVGGAGNLGLPALRRRAAAGRRRWAARRARLERAWAGLLRLPS